MPSLGQLVRGRIALARRSLRGRGAGRRGFAAVLSLVVAAAVFAASYRLFATLRAESAAPLGDGLLRLVLHTSFLFALLRDAVAVPGHLLRARDAALFAAAPLPARRLFAFRMGEALVDAAGPWVQFTTPFVLGYAAAAPAAGLAALAACAGLAVTSFVSAAVVATLTLAGPRHWSGPGRRRRAALAAAGLVAAMALVFAVVLEPGGEVAPPVEARLSVFAALLDAALPSGWVGEIVTRLASGRDLPAAAGIATALLPAGLAFGLSAFARHWEDAWRVAGEAAGGGRRQRPRRGAFDFAARLRSPRARVPAALLGRDGLLFVREPGMLLDLVFLAFLIGALPAVFAGTGAGGIPWGVLAGVVGVEIAYEVSSRSLALERRATHFVRLAPVAPWRVGAARIAAGVAAGAVAGIACWLPAGAWQRLPNATVWLPGLAAGSLVLAAAAVGWAASLAFGEPDWRHPRQMLRLPGRLLLLFVVGLSALGLALGQASQGLAEQLTPAALGSWISLSLAGLAVTAAAALWARRAAAVWSH